MPPSIHKEKGDMKYLKKFTLLILACFLLLICVSCKQEKSGVIDTATNGTKSADVATIPFIESVSFFEADGFLFPGTGVEGYNISSLTFFGKISGSFTSNSDIQKMLSQGYIVVNCLLDDGTEYKPNNYTWSVSGIENDNRNFRLTLFFPQDTTFKDGNIQQIKIISGNTGEVNYSIGNYKIRQVQYTEPKKAFCFESPLEVPTSSKEMTLLYYIAIPEKHSSEDINFEVTNRYITVEPSLL